MFRHQRHVADNGEKGGDMAESTGTARTTERIVKSPPSDLSEQATSSRSIFARFFVEHLMLRASSITSILALTFSGYSLWESSLKLCRKDPQPLGFEMVLPALDQRAFTSGSGTVALHQKDWQSTVQPD